MATTDIYSYPTVNETSSFQNFVVWANNASGGIFLPLVLLALFIIMWVSTINFGGARSFTFAALATSILSIFLVVGNLLNSGYMYFSFVLVGIGFILMLIGKSSRALPQI